MAYQSSPVYRPENPPQEFQRPVSGRQSFLPLNPGDAGPPPCEGLVFTAECPPPFFTPALTARCGQPRPVTPDNRCPPAGARVVAAEPPPALDFIPPLGGTRRLDPPTVTLPGGSRVVTADLPPLEYVPAATGAAAPRLTLWPLRWGAIIPAEQPPPEYAPAIAARHFDPPANVQRTGFVVLPAEMPAPEYTRPVMPSAGARTPNEPPAAAVTGRVVAAELPPQEYAAPIFARSLPLMTTPRPPAGQIVTAEPPPAVDFARPLTAPWPRADQPARGGGVVIVAELPPPHYAPALRGGGGR